MLLKTLFPHLRHFRLESLIKEKQQITLVCVSTRKRAPCPSCQQLSRRIHSRYDRTLTDVSFSGQETLVFEIKATPSGAAAAPIEATLTREFFAN